MNYYAVYQMLFSAAIVAGSQDEVLLVQRGLTVANHTHNYPTKASRFLMNANCESEISLDALNEALHLGGRFLLNAQKPEGNFNYGYDWSSKKFNNEDNSVRQAGTTWSLAFLYADSKEPEMLQAALRALSYFESKSKVLDDGRRIIEYPGEPEGDLGAIALVALAHIDIIRSKPDIEEHKLQDLKAHLRGYLETLLQGERTKGDDHAFYETYKFNKHHSYRGGPDPYFDGESLLAVVRATRYLKDEVLQGHDTWSLVERVASGAWRLHAADAVHAREKSDDAKGYFQWGSMSMYELYQSGQSQFDKFAKHLVSFADWTLNVRKIGNGPYNTGYAFEGVIPAFIVAVQSGATDEAEDFACAIRKGVNKLNSMQVGHSDASGKAAKKEATSDELALGGVQSGKDDTTLHIDTMQHQMHAILQVKQLLVSDKEDALRL